jgi:glycosyltransferase XagB
MSMRKKKSEIPDISIVLPTFNEEHNVGPMIAEIAIAFANSPHSYEVIFVDDSSDNTASIIKQLQKNKDNIVLIVRTPEERTGLGTALLTGARRAAAPVVCVMDSDLQHPPATILPMYEALIRRKKNFVVASRMMEEGSAAGLSSLYRHVVSRMSRLLAWIVLPLTRKTTDPMTGFFMFKKSILTGHDDLAPIGYKLLVEILARIVAIDATDVPFVMRKREFDESKASFTEGIRYFKHLTRLVFYTPRHSIVRYMYVPLAFVSNHYRTIVLSLIFVVLAAYFYRFAASPYDVVILTLSFFLILQLSYTIYTLIYAWDHHDRTEKNASPRTFLSPQKSFTAVIPALNEPLVIPDTIRAVANINYPEHLKETLVVLRDTDTETITAAEQTLAKLGKSNVHIRLISGEPFNKPHHLNAALGIASKEVICIFDAEDEPHPDIYHVVNTVMQRDGADVVQSGVQLMNFESNWYSLFNVLEYFLWFGSALHFYERQGVVPLGGNTVFFNTALLRSVGGWDMHGLTEDAEIGIRLSIRGAKIKVVYDPLHATREETPPTLKSFIKQRTRWSQGFLQVLVKHVRFGGDANTLSLKQRLILLYVLGWPCVHACMFLYLPVALVASFYTKMHPVVTLINATPVLLLLFYLVVQNVALFEFTRIYNKRWSWTLVPKTIFWFYPYQVALSFSSFRAMVRHLRQHTSWEKTEHVNAHRTEDTQVNRA